MRGRRERKRKWRCGKYEKRRELERKKYEGKKRRERVRKWREFINVENQVGKDGLLMTDLLSVGVEA
jgi:hypothetical protein